MYDYDAQYRRLRAAGLKGWAGDCHDRNVARSIETYAKLRRTEVLPMPPARMLELGCGNGGSCGLMAAQGYEAHGVDISEEAIDWARQRAAASGLSSTFHVGSVCDMHWLEDAGFDVVIDGNCLHCLIGADRTSCLREVARVLRTDGTFIVSSMCGQPRSDDAKARFDSKQGCLLEDGAPYRTLKPLEHLCQELQVAGFRIQNAAVSENPWWDHATIVCQTV